MPPRLEDLPPASAAGSRQRGGMAKVAKTEAGQRETAATPTAASSPMEVDEVRSQAPLASPASGEGKGSKGAKGSGRRCGGVDQKTLAKLALQTAMMMRQLMGASSLNFR